MCLTKVRDSIGSCRAERTGPRASLGVLGWSGDLDSKDIPGKCSSFKAPAFPF